MSETVPHTAPLPLWRSALLGPMPLSYPLIAACVFYYLLGALLSLVMGGFDLHALPGYLRSPTDAVQVALGNGGRAPLVVWHLWTLIDAGFLHANILHIAVNMFCLFQIMPAVEQGFGRLRAFSIYILAGIGGSLGSAIWGEFYSLGASGAIFGLLGAVLVYGTLRGDAYGKRLMLFSLQWAGLNFAFGLFGPVAVSNAAHAGGFIGGGLAALALAYPTSPGRLVDPRRMAGVLASLTLICLAIGIGRATSTTWLAISDPTAFEARQSEDLLAKSDAMLALNPADGLTLVQRAEVRANKDDYDGALDDIEKAVAGGRDSQDIQRYRAWIYARRGQAFAQKGDYAAALADTDKAITGGMDSPALHRIKGWLLALLGRNEDAMPEIEIALRDNPRDAVALNIRAHLHEAMGNRVQAIADYQAALKLDPKDENSQQGLQRLSDQK